MALLPKSHTGGVHRPTSVRGCDYDLFAVRTGPTKERL